MRAFGRPQDEHSYLLALTLSKGCAKGSVQRDKSYMLLNKL
jgi:hypothetical protein